MSYLYIKYNSLFKGQFGKSEVVFCSNNYSFIHHHKLTRLSEQESKEFQCDENKFSKKENKK